MAKKIDIKVTEVASEDMQDILDYFSELFESGNVKSFHIGHDDESKSVLVDLDTGDVEISYPDGSVENISGADPSAKEYWDFFGHGDDGDA